MYKPSIGAELASYRGSIGTIYEGRVACQKVQVLFLSKEMGCLDHLISGAGVATDGPTIGAKVSWPVPEKYKILRIS